MIRDEWISPCGNHRIILGDCLAILPTLDTSEVAAVLADPPYGIGEDGGKFRGRKGQGHRVLPKMNWDKERPQQEAFDLMRSCSSDQIIWGGNYFADMLPAARGWLYWDKLMGGDFADGELAWTSIDMALRKFTKCNKAHGAVHPTQKPVALMIWCLSFLPPGLVLDPYAGSCTVAVACARTGRKSISIEIERKYWEIGIQRMQRESERMPLFEPPKPVQPNLF